MAAASEPAALPQIGGRQPPPQPARRASSTVREVGPSNAAPAAAAAGGSSRVSEASSSVPRPARHRSNVSDGHIGAGGAAQLPPMDHRQPASLQPAPQQHDTASQGHPSHYLAPIGVSPSAASSSARTRAAQVPPLRSGSDRQPVASVPGAGGSGAAAVAALRYNSHAYQGSAGNSPPKTWGGPGTTPGAPLSVPELIAELLDQNQMLDSRLVASTSGSDPSGADAVPSLPVRLCDACEDLGPDGTPPRRAVYYCADCRRLGYASELCEECWGDEHRSRRTREHRRVPIPLVAEATTPRGGDAVSDAMTSRTAIDARAVLGMQQQLLHLLLHVLPQPRVSCSSQTDADDGHLRSPSSTSTSPASAVHLLYILEQQETIRRLEIENEALGDLATASLQHHNLAISEVQVLLNNTLLAAASSAASSNNDNNYAREQQQRAALPPGRPPLSPPRQQSKRPPPMQPVVIARSNGGSNAGSPNAPAAREVSIVHGEKHLPGQRHMLLVRFEGAADEEWAALDDVMNHREVRLYMSRKMTPDPGARRGDRDQTPSRPPHHRDLSPPGAFDADGNYESQLGDTERHELAAQLAQLQRLGTAGSMATASRGTVMGDDLIPQPPPDAARDDENLRASAIDDEYGAEEDGGDIPRDNSSSLLRTPRTNNSKGQASPVKERSGVTFRDDVLGSGDDVSSLPSSGRAQTSHSPRRSPATSQPTSPADRSPQGTTELETRRGDEVPRKPLEPRAEQQYERPVVKPDLPAPASHAASTDSIGVTPSASPHALAYTPPPPAVSTSPKSQAPGAGNDAALQAEPAIQEADDEAEARAADRDVVRKYEQRVKLIEERQRHVRQMREEQEERLRQLREQQRAKDEGDRKLIHEEYEQSQEDLKREQPDVAHPLYLTNDRHAALLLHKLNAEIAQAERERAGRDEYRRKKQAKQSPQPPNPEPGAARTEAAEA